MNYYNGAELKIKLHFNSVKVIKKEFIIITDDVRRPEKWEGYIVTFKVNEIDKEIIKTDKLFKKVILKTTHSLLYNRIKETGKVNILASIVITNNKILLKLDETLFEIQNIETIFGDYNQKRTKKFIKKYNTNIK